MKSTAKRNALLSGCTLAIIALLVLQAAWKSNWIPPGKQPVVSGNAWVLPGLSVLLYLLLQFFINRPHLLVKKSLAEIENPQLYSDGPALKWKNIFYLLRLTLVALIAIFSFLD